MIMKDSAARKEMAQQYKERKRIGGVLVVRNTLNDKLLLEATVDLQGSKNRFGFAQETGSCVYLKLQDDWEKQGGRGFVLEVLEELEKKESQSDAEFKADITLLKEIWAEKLAGETLY
jgi:hypothetical protein